MHLDGISRFRHPAGSIFFHQSLLRWCPFRSTQYLVIRFSGVSLNMRQMDSGTRKANQVLTDAEIIEKIRQSGSGEDFGILYKRYYSKVLDKCHSMVRNLTQATELAEEVFIKAFEKLPSFRHQSTFSSWLYTITYNHCVDHLREKMKLHYPKWNSENKLPDLAEEPEESEEEIDYGKMMEILELIHPEEKALIMMKYQDNLSVKQIGQALRISDAAVKMRLKRARTRIITLYRSRFM